MFKILFIALLLNTSFAEMAIAQTALGSKHALVLDEDSGTVLFEKHASDIVPIASLTKLMTAMLVIDAQLDMAEPIMITDQDVDTLKHTSSRLPVGAVLSRSTLLELALMSSDNRAAFALARTLPGGLNDFRLAARNKAHALGMRRTNIEEPTGLSRHNTSTAQDLAKMAIAASKYPEIARFTTASGDSFTVAGNPTHYHNTNRLVSDKKWNILLSKTGFTKEAGRCIIMRVHTSGRTAIMVLLNAKETVTRTADAVIMHRLLHNKPAPQLAIADSSHTTQ